MRGHSLNPMILGERLGEHPGYAYAESHSEGNCTGSFMIRKGDWKYIHFTWYDDLLFNIGEDPGEFTNRINDQTVQRTVDELQGILHNLVDSEEITVRGFKKQEAKLQEMSRSLSRNELFDTLKGRLGKGQS